MDTMGYILLGVIAFIAAKAFGGKAVPSFPGKNNPIDPATGAKIINTSGLMSQFTATPGLAGISGSGPVQPGTNQVAARIPATDIGNGKMYCPYPFTLYKDQADGRFYCYNENAPIDTTSASGPSSLVFGEAPPLDFNLTSGPGYSVPVPIDPNDPAYQAMLKGDSVTISGSQLDTPPPLPAFPPGVFYV